MAVICIGRLSYEDPLYRYLQYDIMPRLGIASNDAQYRVFQFPDSRNVYMYEDSKRGARVVGKFFKSSDRDHARKTGETEFNNLTFLRSFGFSEYPHYIVMPLGFNPDIDNLLVVEYIDGDTLSVVISNAINLEKRNRLFRKLSALAHFLSQLHNRTANESTVNFDESIQYMKRLLKSLAEKWGLDYDSSNELDFWGDIWRRRSCMWEDRNVLVHGDMTPSNILFGKDRDTIAIDLERMKWADRVFDIGRLCGELKHSFFRATDNSFAAEPFIGHFLWEYCRYFPDQNDAFRSITRRIPFYMGITLLRIARNSWIDENYRKKLIHEAKQTLGARG